MTRYLIEVPHEDNKAACDRVVDVFRATGSHFLTNADFGCPDNIHKAWISINVDNKNDALFVVPPPFRDQARVIKVEQFAVEKVEDTMKPLHQ